MGWWFARCAVSLLLAASGALSVLAARERWWPACRFGAFDAGACLARQDSRYNYLAPSDPHTPVGRAADLAGSGLLVLALAVAVLPWLLVRARPLARILSGLVLALPLAVAAQATLRLADTGTIPDSGVVALVAALLWAVAWPAVLVALALRAGSRTRASRWGWVVLVVALTLTTPLPQMLFSLGLLGYVSYDTSPWYEATSGPLLVAAALALWPASAARAATGRLGSRRATEAGRHAGSGQV
jgi:hypothetical protein